MNHLRTASRGADRMRKWQSGRDRGKMSQNCGTNKNLTGKHQRFNHFDNIWIWQTLQN